MSPPSHNASRERLAIWAAALVGIQVGAATVASRFVIGETDPITLALLRYIIGVLCLLPFALPQYLATGSTLRFAARDLLPIAILGAIQFGLLIALLNFGLTYIGASRAALVFALFPLITMLLAAALGRERLTPTKSIGVLLTISGVGLALGEKAFSGNVTWRGELAILGAATCGATCSVLYRPYLRKYPTLAVSAFAMLASVVALAIAAALQGKLQHVPNFSWPGWAAVVFIGLSSGIGYTALLWALANTTPTRVTVFQSLAPVTAAALGWLFLAEPISATFLAGLALVALGIWSAHR
jgi:drug/metabolite transporter (DMT)-like permease